MSKSAYFYIYTPQPYFTADKHIILYYHGPFNNAIISQMAQGLRAETVEFKQAGWKLFSIFVEMVQNIYFHATDHNIYRGNEPVGIVFVEEEEDMFKITAANLATIESLEMIQERCTAINQMTLQELRAYKNELLNTSVEQQNRGGNIGLVQVALLSQENVNFEIHHASQDNGLFTLSSIVKKQQTHVTTI